MKIYYATSISGETNPEAENTNIELIKHLKKYGEVLTEHFADSSLIRVGELTLEDKEIHDRDMKWIMEADVIIAEVSNTSFGVGYEIGRSVENNKKVLCLRRRQNRRLSAMLRGCDKITVKDYDSVENAKEIIDEFIEKL
ncbi:MAG TPA: nucleoside 2-deoxyribosyltransferase [Ignavibacteria bacterium]